MSIERAIRKSQGGGNRQLPFDEDMLRRFFPDTDGDGQPDIPEDFDNARGTGSGVSVSSCTVGVPALIWVRVSRPTGEEPVEVNALEYTPAGDPRFREVEDTINFQLRFPSGVIIT